MGDNATPQADELVFDLSTMDGIQMFVEHVKSEIGQVLFYTKGVPPVCTLFVNKDEAGHEISKPMPMVFQPQSPKWKDMRRSLRNGYLRFDAHGALRVHNQGRRILFQLEHAEFGDHIWYSTADENHMLGKLFGPTTLARLETPALKVLPGKYMS